MSRAEPFFQLRGSRDSIDILLFMYYCHGDLPACLHQYPGTDERGLQVQRDMTAEYPHTMVAWFGPFLAMFFVHSPDAVRMILKTSGTFKGSTLDYLLGSWLFSHFLFFRHFQGFYNRLLVGFALFLILQVFRYFQGLCSRLLARKFALFPFSGFQALSWVLQENIARLGSKGFFSNCAGFRVFARALQ